MEFHVDKVFKEGACKGEEATSQLVAAAYDVVRLVTEKLDTVSQENKCEIQVSLGFEGDNYELTIVACVEVIKYGKAKRSSLFHGVRYMHSIKSYILAGNVTIIVDNLLQEIEKDKHDNDNGVAEDPLVSILTSSG
ncbi:MAG: hypothetical protein JKX80_01565 [Candidatus Pacebacteria bacterium]|nr:hypothetical protein [Candidatus Paceibacterota bacterium]